MRLRRFFKKVPEQLQLHRRVGRNVVLSNSSLEDFVSIGDDCFLHNVKVDSFTYLSSRVTVMNTQIGKSCSIAQGTLIGGGMHPSKIFVSTNPVFYSTEKQCTETFADKMYFEETGRCLIGNDVWIGANAVIMDNINISDGVIIGAGSIVTKDVPSYAIVVGNPARFLRYRFEKKYIDFLLDFQWWNKDIKWLKENFKDFHDIEAFYAKYGHK